MHNSFYRALLPNSLITNQKTILCYAPFIFLPVTLPYFVLCLMVNDYVFFEKRCKGNHKTHFLLAILAT